MSLAVRDILLRVREEDEEAYWASAGEHRLASFVREDAVAHDRAWE